MTIKMILLAFVLIVALEVNAIEKIEIAALSSVELNYPQFASFDVKLINNSGTPIDVMVIDPETKKQVKSFGLGSFGRAIVSIEDSHILKLRNNTLKDMSLSLDFVEKTKMPENQENIPVVNFILYNSSLKSIALIIPDVMNPNLSPLSSSGVALRMGQKIYFKKGLKMETLLVVDEHIKPGDKLDVYKMIKSLERNKVNEK